MQRETYCRLIVDYPVGDPYNRLDAIIDRIAIRNGFTPDGAGVGFGQRTVDYFREDRLFDEGIQVLEDDFTTILAGETLEAHIEWEVWEDDDMVDEECDTLWRLEMGP